MKNNLDFIQQYSDAHDSPGHKMLRVKYSWAGEGQYSALQGMIAKADGCVLDLNQKHIVGSLALDLGFTFEQLSEFIKYLSEECNLLIYSDGKITTAEIQETFSRVSEDREKARERKLKGKRTRTTPENSESSDENIESSPNDRGTFEESKVKESKVKESREELSTGADAPGSSEAISENLIMEKWNEFAKENKLASIISISSKRKKKIKARLKEELFDMDKILKAARGQPFLLGENERQWKMDFDWILENDNNYQKVLEIKYPAKKKNGTGSNQGNSERYENIGD